MATERPSTSMTGIFLRRLVAKKLGMISAGIIIILFCVGILAPVLAPFDYRETELNNGLRGPGFEDYLLGTQIKGHTNTFFVCSLISIYDEDYFFGVAMKGYA